MNATLVHAEKSGGKFDLSKIHADPSCFNIFPCKSLGIHIENILEEIAAQPRIYLHDFSDEMKYSIRENNMLIFPILIFPKSYCTIRFFILLCIWTE